MSVLSRAQGVPSPEAQKIIDLIRSFAAAEPAPDVDANLERIQDLRRIRDAAEDSLYVGFLVVNSPGPGKVAYRTVQDRLGIDKRTVMSYVERARRVLGLG